MHIKLNGRQIECADGMAYAHLVDPAALPAPLGISVRGVALPLTAPVTPGADARVLTYLDEEGRRIYERSLQFLFLAALKRAAPQLRARIEHSYGQGLYINIFGAAASPALAGRIERAMREIVRERLPITSFKSTKAEAIALYEKTREDDKLRLLEYRNFNHFKFYELDGLREYFYGEMVPDAGYLGVFALTFYLPGFVLRMPDVADPSRVAPFKELAKLSHTFAQSAKWAQILGCKNAADLNSMIGEKRLREFIRVNEALQERTIQRIADEFLASGARLILIAGPSSSGKTTLAHRLSIALRVLGKTPLKLSLDDYYLGRDQIPLDEEGEKDFERIETLDTQLLGEHLIRLLQGDAIDAPQYDFASGQRRAQTHSVRALQGQPIVIEGIHALNDQLTAAVPRASKFKIYISALTTLNLDDHNRIRTTDARLLRRIVRDHQFRGTEPEETMAMWRSVRRGEELYIFPFQEEADVMFNSSLAYELPIMKKYVYPMLAAVGKDSPYYTLARRLVKFLNYIATADVEDEIPPNSILREFIGGSCFYRETD